MLEEDHAGRDASEDLLRRALLDNSSSVAVSLKVGGLPLSESVTVIFHGRRDLGTLQTYVTRGSRPAGTTGPAGAAGRDRRSPRARCCGSRAISTWPTPATGRTRSGSTSSRPARSATPW